MHCFSGAALAVLLVLAPSLSFAQSPKPKEAPKQSPVRPTSPRPRPEHVEGPCPKNTCAAGEECLLVEVHCAMAPCPPKPFCVKP